MDMPQAQRTVFFLMPGTIVTYFFLAHLGQVTRILPSLTLQVCVLPRIGRFRLPTLEKNICLTTYQDAYFVNEGLPPWMN